MASEIQAETETNAGGIHVPGGPTPTPAVERILTAAVDVFGAWGFTKTTIQEIVRAAHVSKPLFYRHFRNKQDVFEAVVDRVFTQWREALVAELDRVGGGTAEGLRTLFVAGLAYGRARPLLSRLLTRDSQLLLSTSSDAWDRACDAFRELVAGLLEAGVARGEIRGDLPVAAMADLLTETHFAFANRQILSGNAIEPERIEAIVACILDGIRTRRD